MIVELGADTGLKELIAQGWLALSRVEANRLEEMARFCERLHRESTSGTPERRAAIARESKEAEQEIALFARVLEATRANLYVIDQLRHLRLSRLEYSCEAEHK